MVKHGPKSKPNLTFYQKGIVEQFPHYSTPLQCMWKSILKPKLILTIFKLTRSWHSLFHFWFFRNWSNITTYRGYCTMSWSSQDFSASWVVAFSISVANWKSCLYIMMNLSFYVTVQVPMQGYLEYPSLHILYISPSLGSLHWPEFSNVLSFPVIIF